MVGQLAGGIAHDFNNLLTAILGAADAILERADTSAETRRRRAADPRAASSAARRWCASCWRSRASRPCVPRVVAVNAAIEDAARLLRRLLGEKVAVVLALEQPGRRVLVDPGQLDQVLVNLAVNARDAMAEGGTLTLSSGHATLYRPRLAGSETIPPGRYVTITVADTGGGIPPEVMPRIFEPFFTTSAPGRGRSWRGRPGRDRAGPATVLGIVRQSGGFLDVESRAGIGTSVVVYLPRHVAAGGRGRAAAARHRRDRRRRRRPHRAGGGGRSAGARWCWPARSPGPAGAC